MGYRSVGGVPPQEVQHNGTARIQGHWRASWSSNAPYRLVYQLRHYLGGRSLRWLRSALRLAILGEYIVLVGAHRQ